MIVDVNNPRHTRCRIWLNGDDVGRWCCYADDMTGLVKMYKHDDAGRILAPKVLEEKHGQVRIECPNDDADMPGEPEYHH